MTTNTKEAVKKIYNDMRIEFFRVSISEDVFKMYLTFRNIAEIDFQSITFSISFYFKGVPVHNEQVVLKDFPKTKTVSHSFLLKGKFDRTCLESFELV